jgi:phosphohistidine phosphatase SixA
MKLKLIKKEKSINNTLIIMRHSTRIDHKVSNYIQSNNNHDPPLIYPNALEVINNINNKINYKFTKIITSPLLRCVQTARDFANIHNLDDIYIDFRLIEMCSVNRFYKELNINKDNYQFNFDYVKQYVNDINIQFNQDIDKISLDYNNYSDLQDLYNENKKKINENILVITHYPNMTKFCQFFNKKIISENIYPIYCAYIIIKNNEIIESNEIIKSIK